MFRPRPDQAEGLRRLLDRGSLRVVSVGAGGGTPADVVNLAGALGELGSDVLILDARPGGGVAAALGLRPCYGLGDVFSRERELDEVILRGPAGIRILPLAHGADALARVPPQQRQRLIERCSRLGFPVDTLLVDAVADAASALSWPAAAVQEVIVIAGGGAAAIKAAYATVKRLANEHARREFHVLLRNVRSEREAQAIFDNMARTARRYLQVALHFLGHVPPDDRLQDAARLRLPVVAAFPRADAAGSFRRLAQAIAGWPRTESEGCGFDDFMRRLIHADAVHATAA